MTADGTNGAPTASAASDRFGPLTAEDCDVIIKALIATRMRPSAWWPIADRLAGAYQRDIEGRT
jgi:hypothetical protein